MGSPLIPVKIANISSKKSCNAVSAGHRGKHERAWRRESTSQPDLQRPREDPASAVIAHHQPSTKAEHGSRGGRRKVLLGPEALHDLVRIERQEHAPFSVAPDRGDRQAVGGHEAPSALPCAAVPLQQRRDRVVAQQAGEQGDLRRAVGAEQSRRRHRAIRFPPPKQRRPALGRSQLLEAATAQVRVDLIRNPEVVEQGQLTG